MQILSANANSATTSPAHPNYDQFTTPASDQTATTADIQTEERRWFNPRVSKNSLIAQVFIGAFSVMMIILSFPLMAWVKSKAIHPICLV